MPVSLFQKLFNALAFANVGTLSEFRRVLERHSPLVATAMPERNDNVLSFRKGEARTAFAFDNPLLPQTRLKP